MPDPFTNARSYFDPTFPSSGDGYSIASHRNSLSGLGFLDMLPLQPRAHNPANRSIMVRGRDSSAFFNPVYYGNADQRTPFVSGDTGNFATPASNPRIDIVYMTPSGDYKIQQGTEAASPSLPSLSPSGDSRFPICAVWNRPSQAKIVNFEDKGANTGDGYIYQDLRPWMRTAGAGSTSLGSSTPVSPTGDAQAGPGVLTNAAHADHVHGGVHAVRVVGQSNMQGDVEFAGGSGVLTQSGRRITINTKIIQTVYTQSGAVNSGATNYVDDDTPPQTSEVNMFSALDTTITPTAANNILKVEFQMNLSSSSSGAVLAALFQDAGASAIDVCPGSLGAAGVTGNLKHTFYKVAGTVSAITFKLGAACAAGTITLNGVSAAARFAGTEISSLSVTEIAV